MPLSNTSISNFQQILQNVSIFEIGGIQVDGNLRLPTFEKQKTENVDFYEVEAFIM